MGPTKKSTSKSSASLAAVSAASVGGYLQNVANRHRVPRAEGGKGTRRKVSMVTSVSTKQKDEEILSKEEKGESLQIAHHEEEEDAWDEVEIPSLVKSQEMHLDPSDLTKTQRDANTNLASEFPQVKADSTGSPAALPFHSGDDRRLGTHSWRERDEAYEEMREQRDRLAAQRSSDKMQKIFFRVTELIAVCMRGGFLWREARHPKLLRCLLHARRDEGTTKHFPFVSAVSEARVLVETSRDEAHRAVSLAPAWVTAEHDGARNFTSRAVLTLLKAMHECFTLQRGEGESGGGGYSRWCVRLQLGYLYGVVRSHLKEQETSPRDDTGRIVLPHPLYLSLIFLSLSALSGLDARLIVAVDANTLTTRTESPQQENIKESGSPLEKLSLFTKSNSTSNRATAATEGIRNNKDPVQASERQRPLNCFWLEVWSCERQSFLSVNPCKNVSTVWGAPYVFAFGKGKTVDVTPRYTSSLSKSYTGCLRLGRCSEYRFLWKNSLPWGDTREVSQILEETFSFRGAHQSVQEERESRQLEMLRYSEKIPNTLSQLRHHPLFVVESNLTRMEGIYPKDKFHIVGSVKGNTVYKRSAVQALRSRDGWIRLGRSLINENAEPYKVVPPPASRPFTSPSHFYGYWQTKPFEPVPLQDGHLPQHGNTKWYILLSHCPPPGISHLREINIARVARRMEVEFRLAVVGFTHKKVQENRRGFWTPDVDGVVVREKDAVPLLRAYQQWVKATEEQAAARRRDRALHWWFFLAQRLLATERLKSMYTKGIAKKWATR